MKTSILTAILFAAMFCCKAQPPETMLDASFGNKGRVVYTDSNRHADTNYRFMVYKIAMQGKKIIVAGNNENSLGNNPYHDTTFLFRLNANGSLDKSFGRQGILVSPFAPYIVIDIHALHCQSNGKIITMFSSGGRKSYIQGLARLNANGMLQHFWKWRSDNIGKHT